MLRILRNSIFGLVLISTLFSAAPPASAAGYPDRPVHWIIGFSAGGPVDIVARIMAQWLSDRLGQQFIVENRTGSGGNIAAAAAISSPADGYTLLFVAPNNAISTSLYKKLPFDFLRDTVPVASIMQLTNMLVVSNAFPAKTVQEFIDYCKANPGKISFASSGNGTSVHMSAELFKVMTKCDMVHVPYRGSAIAFPDIISNKVQLIFDNLPSALEQAKGGNVRALGVTSPQRWPSVPDVPAIAETVPGFEAVGFYGISAPKGTPPDVIDILNKAVGEALKDPKLIARLAETGGIPKPMTPAELRQAGHRRDREVAQGGGVRRGFGGLAPSRGQEAVARRQRRQGEPRAPLKTKLAKTTPCTVERSSDHKGLRQRKNRALGMAI
ncbi:tripartite-type tricarboxylate transporter receptor subunit TctC [Bradyrhizobium sp. LM4.3]